MDGKGDPGTNRQPDRARETDLMTLPRKESPYFAGDGFQALEMPCRGDEASMAVPLPSKDRTLAALPRFKMTCPCDLGQTLSDLGMPSAFGSGADFSGIAREGLFLDRVAHKGFIEVDEKGTEAAAATAVVAYPKSAPPQPTGSRSFSGPTARSSSSSGT
jgi:serpin B